MRYGKLRVKCTQILSISYGDREVVFNRFSIIYTTLAFSKTKIKFKCPTIPHPQPPPNEDHYCVLVNFTV